jgi:hypothetical protein
MGPIPSRASDLPVGSVLYPDRTPKCFPQVSGQMPRLFYSGVFTNRATAISTGPPGSPVIPLVPPSVVLSPGGAQQYGLPQPKRFYPQIPRSEYSCQPAGPSSRGTPRTDRPRGIHRNFAYHHIELNENMEFERPSSISPPGAQHASRVGCRSVVDLSNPEPHSQLENLALRHQLGVLHRSVKRPKLTPSDRALRAVRGLERLAICSGYRQTGHHDCLTSQELPSVLDMERSARAAGAAGCPERRPSTDLEIEPRESAMGAPLYTRQTAQARIHVGETSCTST